MCSQSGTNKSTNEYSDNIRRASEFIKNADHLLIGVGSGLSAAGGLNYADPLLAKMWYPEYYSMGKRSIIEIMSDFWPNSISEMNAAAFWGFWARHIYHIRYEAEVLQPYKDLFDIVRDKVFFICSTNADGQLAKAGFSERKIFAPQGDYAYFQCQKPCTQDICDNKAMIETMVSNMLDPFEIHNEDIPRCPRCGAFLIPNLRCDYQFVEKLHMENREQYLAFVNGAADKRTVLLELGVGYNTPGIIRYPFDEMTAALPDAMLIRINMSDASVPLKIRGKAIVLECDLADALKKIKAG